MVLALPLLFFVALEAILRVVGYGPDLSLFLRETIGERDYYVMNPEVKGRYFSAVDFRPSTSLDYFPVEKQKGTFRVFCLGGSTTVGFPHGYIGSFSTFLRDRLRSAFPDRTIEVINLGMTATNSFTTADIACELPAYDPDVIIVYDGHNEFYGALGVVSHETAGGGRWLSRLYLRMVHMRVFQLVRDLYVFIRELAGRPETSLRSGTLMERLARGQYVTQGSETYLRAHTTFAQNIAELVEICRSAGIPLVLSTQVSNLRDQPPFISDDRLRTDPSRWAQYNSHINRALELRMNGSFDSALVEFRAALALDTLRAEAHYAQARTLDTLGSWSQAAPAYVRARDLDMLRFRTSTDFNNVIKAAADGNRVIVVDTELLFAENSPHGLIGSTLLLEHLHPTLYGYFLLGRAYAAALRGAGLPADTASWRARDTISDAELWKRRPSTVLDERLARRRIELLTTGWPFQPEELPVRAPDPSDSLGVVAEEILTGGMSWEEGTVHMAEMFARAGNAPGAESMYRAIINQLPVNVSPYLRLGELLVAGGRSADAASVLRRSLDVEKTHTACRMLGVIELNRGKPSAAIPMFSDAVSLSATSGDRVSAGHLLALALTRAGNDQEAIRRLEWVLAIDPAHTPSRSLLAFLQKKSR